MTAPGIALASAATSGGGRRFDLDWLRIGAFGLLILFHCGMFYVTWDWHVKSPRASSALEPLMLLLSPWRMKLLFLISGVATRFMADRMSPGDLARNRWRRLFWPLLFAVLVVVPPQSYLEIVTKIDYAGSYLDFYPLYLTVYRHWCRETCLIVPTWNHMWFVGYLLVYTLILAPVMPRLRRATRDWPTTRVAAAAFLIAPWIYLTLARWFLAPLFPETHDLVTDVYLHAVYLPLFVLGFAMARHDAPFDWARAARVPALILALAAYGAHAWIRAMPDANASLFLPMIRNALYDGQAWAMIIALLGFARQHLSNADGPWRRWLTQAVFPFYVVHQTVIVVAAYHLQALGLPLAVEGPTLVAITALACLGSAILAQRVPVMGRVLGWAPSA